MIENSAIPLRVGEVSPRRRLAKAARSGSLSANSQPKVSTRVFAPEARRIIAGGGAQRNHRNFWRNPFPAPEGRQTEIGLSPLRGWDNVFGRIRWFIHRLISGVPPGQRVNPDLRRNFSSTVSESLSPVHCGKSRGPDGSHDYLTRLVNKATQTRQFALGLAPVLLFFILLCSALPAKAQSGDQQLRWGGDAEGGAPYLLPDPKNPREIIGFEIDLMNAVGKQLNRKSVFVQNQWDGLIPGLQRGNYDLAVNGIEITDDRKQQVNFSIPYYACGEQLSVRAGENSINSLADLKGKAVGTLKASLAQRILEREGGIEVR